MPASYECWHSFYDQLVVDRAYPGSNVLRSIVYDQLFTIKFRAPILYVLVFTVWKRARSVFSQLNRADYTVLYSENKYYKYVLSCTLYSTLHDEIYLLYNMITVLKVRSV